MLCPVCGSDNGFCDCLMAGLRGQGSTEPPGPTTGQPEQITLDDPDGPGGPHGRGTLEAQHGTGWAGDLLDFLRDFASASGQAGPPRAGSPEAGSPQSGPAVPAEQLGRNRPVGRAALDLDLGENGPLAIAGIAPEPSSPATGPVAHSADVVTPRRPAHDEPPQFKAPEDNCLSWDVPRPGPDRGQLS